MNIFISYKFEDNNKRRELESLMHNPNTKFGHTPISEKEDKRYLGKDGIMNYLRTLIKNIDVMLVIVGRDTHNSKWIRYEIDVANSQRKPVIPIRIPYTNGGIPINIKQRNCIEWDYRRIKDAINRSKNY